MLLIIDIMLYIAYTEYPESSRFVINSCSANKLLMNSYKKKMVPQKLFFLGSRIYSPRCADILSKNLVIALLELSTKILIFLLRIREF